MQHPPRMQASVHKTGRKARFFRVGPSWLYSSNLCKVLNKGTWVSQANGLDSVRARKSNTDRRSEIPQWR